MAIWGFRTSVVNATDQSISFNVSDGGVCPLRDLPGGRSRSVSLSLIRKRCRERGPSNWLIRVLINGRFHGMHLDPRLHVLKMTRIVFRYKWKSDGSCALIAEGVVETFSDRIFGCCINWQKRNYDIIAEADSTWRRNIRIFQDPIIPLEQNGNNLQVREVGVGGPEIVAAPLIGTENGLHYKYFTGLLFLRLHGVSARFLPLVRQESKRFIRAIPTQKIKIERLWSGSGGGKSIPASVYSKAAVESRKRLYRLLSLRRRVMFNRFLLFGFAFTLVASLHLFRIWLCM